LSDNRDEGLDVTTADSFWFLSAGAGVRTLDRIECLDFLPTKRVGRLGYVTEDGPRIVPLNYVATADAIVVRTLAYGEVARYSVDRRVAFEVDELDESSRSGRSVLVVGTARMVSVDELQKILNQGGGPEPWAGGTRTLFLTIPMTIVTGRQVMGS
jgi:hypothetical protein